MAQEDRELHRADNQTISENRREREALFVPRADIIETSDSLIVIADMPGVDEKSVDIQVEHNVLTIAGRVETEIFEGFQLGYQEFETGQFARQFTLSDEVDVNGIEASVRNGVLEIRLPKVESARPHKIAVRAG
ncbi:MAG: Hsp20/alpha crystallin family protein [Candidatus Riflebacteria bacterium]|nr:Hsp20/alpha crystallin family protein [Candidatus Riflebacteria bacterium]